MIQTILDELSFAVPERKYFVRILVRLTAAVLLGAVTGLERQSEGKRAGLRTHMLVSLGAALFTLVGVESFGDGAGKGLDISRIVQGVATGIGFLGAGTIIKLSDSTEVRGLNSAASIWLTAAVGMAVGAGWLWPALIGVVLSVLILHTLHNFERRLKHRNGPPKDKTDPKP